MPATSPTLEAGERLLGGAPPVLGVLLGPAGARRRERVADLAAGEQLAVGRDGDRLHRRRSRRRARRARHRHLAMFAKRTRKAKLAWPGHAAPPGVGEDPLQRGGGRAAHRRPRRRASTAARCGVAQAEARTCARSSSAIGSVQPGRELREEAAEDDGLEVEQVGRRRDPHAEPAARLLQRRERPLVAAAGALDQLAAPGGPRRRSAPISGRPAISSSASRPDERLQAAAAPAPARPPAALERHVPELAAEPAAAAEQLAADDQPGAHADLARHVEHVAEPARRALPQLGEGGEVGLVVRRHRESPDRRAGGAARRPPARRVQPRLGATSSTPRSASTSPGRPTVAPDRSAGRLLHGGQRVGGQRRDVLEHLGAAHPAVVARLERDVALLAGEVERLHGQVVDVDLEPRGRRRRYDDSSTTCPGRPTVPR